MPIKKNELNQFDVQEYEFSKLEDSQLGTRDFEFQKIENDQFVVEKNNIKPDQEFNNAIDSGFQVEGIVKEHRKHDAYRKQVLNKEIESKVSALEGEHKKKGYEAGFQQGMEEARKEWDQKLQNEMSVKVQEIQEFFETIKKTKDEALESHSEELLGTVRSLTKWLLLREVKEDDEHIKKTLYYLLNEVDNFKNLVITFDQKNYDKYQNIISELSEKIGELKNCKVVPDLHYSYEGVRVETDRNILDASLDKQFEKIDEIFEQVINEKSE